MPNSYTPDRIFKPHLTAIKDSYILSFSQDRLITQKFPSEGYTRKSLRDSV